LRAGESATAGSTTLRLGHAGLCTMWSALRAGVRHAGCVSWQGAAPRASSCSARRCSASFRNSSCQANPPRVATPLRAPCRNSCGPPRGLATSQSTAQVSLQCLHSEKKEGLGLGDPPITTLPQYLYFFSSASSGAHSAVPVLRSRHRTVPSHRDHLARATPLPRATRESFPLRPTGDDDR